MKILCVFGKHNYGNPARGLGYEYSNFIPAIRRLGHAVHFFESWNKSVYNDFASLNRALLETVETVNPDVILFILISYEIWMETLAEISKNCNAILINWAPDDSWKYEQCSKFIARHFDVHATTYPEILSQAGQDGIKNVVLAQWAANVETLCEPLPAKRCLYQVSFVGTSYGNRRRWISNLHKRGVTVECFGHGWERGPVSSEDISRIMRESVISLNFADSGLVFSGLVPRRSRQIKARTFEVPGAGGFLMSEHAENLDSFYVAGKEIVTFTGLGDLVDKINFYLAHSTERDEIAWRGYVRTRNEHTYEDRFRELFRTALERFPIRSDGAKAEKQCKFDFVFFSELQRHYATGLWLNLVRWLLLIPCVALLGRKRGPRAARRLLYELSWRLLGQKTFTASGWPGRLFYHES